MKKLVIFVFTVFFVSSGVLAQEQEQPTIQDLDFLIGTWEVTFDFYNPRTQEEEIELRETGTVTCEYDLPFNDEYKYIVCTGYMSGDNGWVRTFKEYAEYNSLAGTYQRMAIYSNWPGMAMDQMFLDEENHILDVRGELQVQNHLTERYQDYYYFNEDYTSYTRRAVSNFSDMSPAEYNLVFTSTGRKVD